MKVCLAPIVLLDIAQQVHLTRTHGAHMTSNNSSRVQYAIIQVRQCHGDIERFAIAYNDERVLREFLARPCIVATGFSSPGEAMKNSSTAGNGRGRLWNVFRRFSGWRGCSHLLHLKMRMLSRLQAEVNALTLTNNIIHITGAALHKTHSRFMHALRRLEPAVQ